MVTYIKSITFDCRDALRLAAFWAACLGSDVDEDSTSGRAFVEAAGWGGPNIWFNAVPSRSRLDRRRGAAVDQARRKRVA